MPHVCWGQFSISERGKLQIGYSFARINSLTRYIKKPYSNVSDTNKPKKVARSK